MEPNERARKQIETRSRRPKTRPKRLAAGQLKGRPLGDTDRPDRVKPSVAAARRSAVPQNEGRRRPQLERPASARPIEEQSLRLRLRVEGQSIAVMDADIVDAPAALPEELRGTDFLEVRLGDRILAAQALRDPGVAIGIPDRSDKAMRGHRFIELDHYELAVRVPLGPLEAIIADSVQGRGASRRTGPRLEVAIFKARASLSVDPRRAGSLEGQRRGQLDRVARSEPLPVDRLYGAGGRQRKRGDEAE